MEKKLKDSNCLDKMKKMASKYGYDKHNGDGTLTKYGYSNHI